MPHNRVRSGVQFRNLILIILASILPLAGCSSGTAAPRFELVSAQTVDRSDEGRVIKLTFRGENANAHEIKLRNAKYRVGADGVELFRGKRSAEVTLPRYGRVNLELLAAFPESLAPTNLNTISVEGVLEYLPPGPFAEALYDNRLSRPSVRLKGAVPLQD